MSHDSYDKWTSRKFGMVELWFIIIKYDFWSWYWRKAIAHLRRENATRLANGLTYKSFCRIQSHNIFMRTVANSTCFHWTRGTGTRGKKLAKPTATDSPSDGWSTTAARSELTLRVYNRSSSETKDASSSSGGDHHDLFSLLSHCFHLLNCCGQGCCE